jgi:hypothetical protein
MRPARVTRRSPRFLALRLCRLSVAACALAAFSAQHDGAFKDVFVHDVKAGDLLTAARVALFGGPGGAARLRSMRFKGQSRFPAEGGSLLSAAVELRVLLPDRFMRIDTGPFGRRVTGYAQSVPFDVIESPDGKRTPDPRDPASILRAERAVLARLMFGVAAYASEEVSLHLYTRETPTEMPGASDPLGIDAISKDGFTARIVFDARSRMPARVLFWGADRTVLTMALTDRRSTGGLKAPYRIVTTAGDRIVDELLFDEIAVNPSLSKTDFSH